MAKIKRVIQKIEAVRESGFEQQFWPIVIALCILGGFVYGASLALLDGIWLWASLISVPIVICSLIAILHMVDNRILRRSIQLAMILSITFHIALLLMLSFTNIFGRQFKPRDVARQAERQPVVVNEYAQVNTQQFREVRKEEVPVEIEEVEQQATEQQTSTEQPQPTPVDNPQQQPRPNVNRRQQPADSMPRRDKSLSRISRSETQVQPKSGTSAEKVETKTTESKVQARDTTVQKKGTANSPAKLMREAPQANPNRAQTKIVEKRNPEESEQPADSVPQPLNHRMNRSQKLVANAGSTSKVKSEKPTESKSKPRETPTETASASKIERRDVASQTQPQKSPAQPNNSPATAVKPSKTANRRSQKTTEQESESPAQPAQLARSNTRVQPRIETPTASSSKAAENPTAQTQSDSKSAQNNLTPAQTQVARKQPTKTITPSKQTPRAARADMPENRRESNAIARRPNRQQQPDVAQSSSSTMSRAETANPVSARTETRVESETQQSVVKSDTPQPSQTSSQIARQQTRSRESTASRTPAPQPTTSRESQTARTIPRRSNSSTPSVSPTEPTTAQPRRSTDVAANVRSRTNVESPSRSNSDSADGNSSPQPASLTVSRSNTGTAGAGSSANLVSDSPAADAPSMTASNARRREEATRSTPQDEALTASSSSRVPRSAAGRPLPSSSVAADNSPDASQPGQRDPGTLTANSSPATIDSASSATPSTVSADAGTSQVDLGPVKIVSESGSSRASGGGQTTPNMPQQADRISRSTNASGSPPSLLAAVEDADSAAPQADGGGQPQQNENDLKATSLVQLQRAGETPTTSGPSNEVTTGPPSDASSALETSSTIAARAERSETAPGEQQAGGGTPSDQQTAQLVRAKLTGGPETSSIALIENESTDAPRSDANGKTLAAETTGIDTPSISAVASRTGDTLLQKLAGGDTGADDPSSNEDFSGDSNSSRRNQSDPNATDTSPATPGAANLARNGSAPAISTNVSADNAGDMVAAAASAESGGGGANLDATEVSIAVSASGSKTGMEASGADGPADSRPNTTPGEAGGKRRSREEEAGSIGDLAADGTSERKQLDGELASSTSVDISDLAIPMGETGDGSEMAGDLSGVENIGLVRQEANAGEMLMIDAPDGPAGAGAVDSAESGLNSRRAREDIGPLQAFSDTRFFRNNPGGVPTLNKVAVFANDAFDGRGMLKESGGEPTTEKAIDMGLEYLSGIQRGDGRWTLEHDDDDSISMYSDTAATGLALLAFQGAGYNHREYKYAAQLREALQWLIDNQEADGCLFIESTDYSNSKVRLYSHGIAALALCEAYGMTQDPALKEPAEMALWYIAKSQDQELGGWRYIPGSGADTSVTGWMMMALKSGRLAGLDADEKAFEKIRYWLDQARTTDESYLYRYNPYAEDEGNIIRSHGRKPTQCMTSVGLLMRLYMGWNRDNIDMLKGADYLLTQMPDDTTTELRDTYYWYYATQVLRHIGGERWEQWHDKLHPLLVESQVATGKKAGSWDPLGPVPDRWGPHGGRLYVTTMNLLSLEVDYRLLPLYDKTVE